MGEGILAPQLPCMSPSLSLFGRSHDPALKRSLVSRDKCLLLLFYALFIKLCTAWSCLCGLESILKNRMKWYWIKTIWALPLGDLHGKDPPRKGIMEKQNKPTRTKKNTTIMCLLCHFITIFRLTWETRCWFDKMLTIFHYILNVPQNARVQRRRCLAHAS